MPEVLTKYPGYLADFQALEQGLAGSEPTWLRQLRQQALARFAELGFPAARRGNEKWKYTSVTPIATGVFRYAADASPNGVKAATLRQLAPWQKGWMSLVFLNGRFSPALSTVPARADGIRVASLAEAFHTDEELVRQHLAHYVPFEEDGFAALNTAFLRDGALVHVSGRDTQHPPVHLVFVATEEDQPTVFHPRTLIVTDAQTKLTVLESHISTGHGAYFANAVTEIVVGEGSNVEHYKLLLESPNAFHVTVARAHVGRDSRFSTTSFAKGAALARNDLTVALAGQGSSGSLRGLHLTTGSEHIDHHIGIDHAAPHSTSYQYFKGILSGESRAVYTGRVLMREGAVKSNAVQADKNLILSEHAEVDTKPSMEIWCDDVKATHGATAGQIAEAEDALFYMRSRGIDLETASALLVRGFASEILNTIALEPLRAYLDKLTAAMLPGFQYREQGHGQQ